jgi:TonB family protein
MRASYGSACVLLPFVVCCGGSGQSSPAPAPPPSPPQAAAPSSSSAPPPNPDAAAVERARPSLRACYEKARSANPALGRTTVTLSLRVDETGHVSSVDLEYKHRFDEAAKGCMRDAAFTIQLPPGTPRRVEVPITFETK